MYVSKDYKENYKQERRYDIDERGSIVMEKRLSIWWWPARGGKNYTVLSKAVKLAEEGRKINIFTNSRLCLLNSRKKIEDFGISDIGRKNIKFNTFHRMGTSSTIDYVDDNSIVILDEIGFIEDKHGVTRIINMLKKGCNVVVLGDPLQLSTEAPLLFKLISLSSNFNEWFESVKDSRFYFDMFKYQYLYNFFNIKKNPYIEAVEYDVLLPFFESNPYCRPYMVPYDGDIPTACQYLEENGFSNCVLDSLNSKHYSKNTQYITYDTDIEGIVTKFCMEHLKIHGNNYFEFPKLGKVPYFTELRIRTDSKDYYRGEEEEPLFVNGDTIILDGVYEDGNPRVENKRTGEKFALKKMYWNYVRLAQVATIQLFQGYHVDKNVIAVLNKNYVPCNLIWATITRSTKWVDFILIDKEEMKIVDNCSAVEKLFKGWSNPKIHDVFGRFWGNIFNGEAKKLIMKKLENLCDNSREETLRKLGRLIGDDNLAKILAWLDFDDEYFCESITKYIQNNQLKVSTKALKNIAGNITAANKLFIGSHYKLTKLSQYGKFIIETNQDLVATVKEIESNYNMSHIPNWKKNLLTGVKDKIGHSKNFDIWWEFADPNTSRTESFGRFAKIPYLASFVKYNPYLFGKDMEEYTYNILKEYKDDHNNFAQIFLDCLEFFRDPDNQEGSKHKNIMRNVTNYIKRKYPLQGSSKSLQIRTAPKSVSTASKSNIIIENIPDIPKSEVEENIKSFVLLDTNNNRKIMYNTDFQGVIESQERIKPKYHPCIKWKSNPDSYITPKEAIDNMNRSVIKNDKYKYLSIGTNLKYAGYCYIDIDAEASPEIREEISNILKATYQTDPYMLFDPDNPNICHIYGYLPKELILKFKSGRNVKTKNNDHVDFFVPAGDYADWRKNKSGKGSQMVDFSHPLWIEFLKKHYDTLLSAI